MSEPSRPRLRDRLRDWFLHILSDDALTQAINLAIECRGGASVPYPFRGPLRALLRDVLGRLPLAEFHRRWAALSAAGEPQLEHYRALCLLFYRLRAADPNRWRLGAAYSKEDQRYTFVRDVICSQIRALTEPPEVVPASAPVGTGKEGAPTQGGSGASRTR